MGDWHREKSQFNTYWSVKHYYRLEILEEKGNYFTWRQQKRLLDEAKEEIKSILQLVYTRATIKQVRILKSIHFITEEDLYINSVGRYQRIGEGSIRGALDQIKSNEYIQKKKEKSMEILVRTRP